MRTLENQCVDCGLPCIGNSCRYKNVSVYYCDNCDNEGAEYRIDSKDLCKDCAKSYIKEAFDDLGLSEQAELLNLDFHTIDD